MQRKQRRLAGSVSTDEAEQLSRVEREVDAAQRLHPTEPLAQPDDEDLSQVAC